MPAAVALVDNQMCYLAASRKWLSDYGLKETNIRGRSHYEIFPEIPERWRAIHRTCLAGQMAAGVAHEINNPLEAINLRGELIQELCNRKPVPVTKIADKANQIVATTLRIAAIIKALRAIARDTKGEPHSLCRIGNIVSDTLELYQARLCHHQIRLLAELNGLEDKMIEVNAAEIVQVLVNLLNNSFDATKGQADAWIRINVQAIGESVKIALSASEKKSA